MVTHRGVGAVSVRVVAAEAGISAGSLRHVLATKEDLLAAAMELAIARAHERFLQTVPAMESTDDLVQWLLVLLPLDEQSRVELEIQLALIAEAAGHPALATLRDEAFEGVRQACYAVLVNGMDAGLLVEHDPDQEAVRLHVLLDGLALHLRAHTSALSPETAQRMLAEHLHRLSVESSA